MKRFKPICITAFIANVLLLFLLFSITPTILKITMMMVGSVIIGVAGLSSGMRETMLTI